MGKYGPEKTPFLVPFHTMHCDSYVNKWYYQLIFIYQLHTLLLVPLFHLNKNGTNITILQLFTLLDNQIKTTFSVYVLHNVQVPLPVSQCLILSGFSSIHDLLKLDCFYQFKIMNVICSTSKFKDFFHKVEFKTVFWLNSS